MDILQQAPEIRLRRKAHGSIMVYEPQPNFRQRLSRHAPSSLVSPRVTEGGFVHGFTQGQIEIDATKARSVT